MCSLFPKGPTPIHFLKLGTAFPPAQPDLPFDTSTIRHVRKAVTQRLPTFDVAAEGGSGQRADPERSDPGAPALDRPDLPVMERQIEQACQ